jgi:hypothetical protein
MGYVECELLRTLFLHALYMVMQKTHMNQKQRRTLFINNQVNNQVILEPN